MILETSENPKTCVTCKYLLGKREKIEDWQERWKCYHTKNIKGTEVHPVTGENITYLKEEEIFILRTHALLPPPIIESCGGNWWEEYIHPSTIGGMEATEVFSDEAIEQNRKAASERLEKIRNRKLKPEDFSNL